MSTTATYHTTVNWVAGHEGRIHMGNGPEMAFSAPPDAHGLVDVLTPEDAFVGAVNTCIMLMFLWACERFKLELLAYECRAEGTKLIELDRTETFTSVRSPAAHPRVGGRPGARNSAPARRAGPGRCREVQPGRQLGEVPGRHRTGDRHRGRRSLTYISRLPARSYVPVSAFRPRSRCLPRCNCDALLSGTTRFDVRPLTLFPRSYTATRTHANEAK